MPNKARQTTKIQADPPASEIIYIDSWIPQAVGSFLHSDPQRIELGISVQFLFAGALLTSFNQFEPWIHQETIRNSSKRHQQHCCCFPTAQNGGPPGPGWASWVACGKAATCGVARCPGGVGGAINLLPKAPRFFSKELPNSALLLHNISYFLYITYINFIVHHTHTHIMYIIHFNFISYILLHHLHHIHQLNLHHLHHLHHLTRQMLHRTCYTGVVTQELLHRSCYAGVLRQEFLDRSCYTGVVTQKLLRRSS